MGQKMRPQNKQGAELEEEPEVMASHAQRHCSELQKVTDVPAVTYTQSHTSNLQIVFKMEEWVSSTLISVTSRNFAETVSKVCGLQPYTVNKVCWFDWRPVIC